MNPHPFRAAIESGELDNIGDLFAENAVLNSPVAHRPYHGRGVIAAIIAAVASVLEGFRFEKELTGGGATCDTAGRPATRPPASRRGP